MEGRPFPEIFCAICSKPANLRIDLPADENGNAVHEDCYVNRFFSARSDRAAPNSTIALPLFPIHLPCPDSLIQSTKVRRAGNLT
jgi:hypothetical protein